MTWLYSNVASATTLQYSILPYYLPVSLVNGAKVSPVMFVANVSSTGCPTAKPGQCPSLHSNEEQGSDKVSKADKEEQPEWLNRAFVAEEHRPGVMFEGTIDECIDWVVNATDGRGKLRIYYLRTTKRGLGLRELVN